MQAFLNDAWSQGKAPVFLMFDDERQSIDPETEFIEKLGIDVRHCEDAAEFIAAVEVCMSDSSDEVIVGISIDNRMPDIKTVKFPKRSRKQIRDRSNSGIFILKEFIKYINSEDIYTDFPILILTGNPVDYEFENIFVDKSKYNVHFCKKQISIVEHLDVPRGYLSSFQAIVQEIVKNIQGKIGRDLKRLDVGLRARFDAADVVKQVFSLSDGELLEVMGVSSGFNVDLGQVRAGYADMPNRDWVDRVDLLFDLTLFLENVEFDEGLDSRGWMEQCIPSRSDMRTLFSIATEGTVTELQSAINSISGSEPFSVPSR